MDASARCAGETRRAQLGHPGVVMALSPKGAFDSHDIAGGKSWKYTARKAGEYAYICTLHPNMKGTLKVE